jgi:hypothetical protein
MSTERWYVMVLCDNQEHAELVQHYIRRKFRRLALRIRVVPGVSSEVIQDAPEAPYPSGGHDAVERELDDLKLGYDHTQPPPAAEAATDEGDIA